MTCCCRGPAGPAGPPGPPGPPGPGGGGDAPFELSVNAARSLGPYFDASVVLSTGSIPNPVGGFTGGGVGNKSIRGFIGLAGLSIASIGAIEFVWENVTGPSGPFAIPPEPATVVTPAVNLVVDFDPLGAGDLRIVVLLTDQLNPAVVADVGTYVNDGFGVLTYSWDGATNGVLIVNAPPNAVPGGVAPTVNVGPGWFERTYSWQALVLANPDAILVDAFPSDGGMPAGTVCPAVMIVSGDSGNTTRSGKRIKELTVNGVQYIGPLA
jgi:hypothetical protein